MLKNIHLTHNKLSKTITMKKLQKMKRASNYAALLTSLLVLNSCQGEDEVNTTLDETTEIEYVYGPSVKIGPDISDNTSAKATDSSTPWRDITEDDLRNLSEDSDTNFLSDDEPRSRFNFAFEPSNNKPAAVSVNNMLFGSGTNPNDEYGWYAQIRTFASPVTQEESDLTPFTDMPGVAARSERNYLDEDRIMEVSGEWRVTATNETNWNVTGSISSTVGGSVGFPGLVSVEASVTVGLESGGGGSSSYSVTEVLSGGAILVPSGKVANWKIEERHRDYNSTWEVPVEFQGEVSADYGQEVEGHYFWAVPAEDFFYEYVGDDKRQYIVDVSEEYGKEIRITAWITDN